MFFEEFEKKVQNSQLPNSIILWGAAEDLIFECVFKIKNAFKTQFPAGKINYVDAGQLKFENVLVATQTQELFSNQQLTVVYNAEKFFLKMDEEDLAVFKDCLTANSNCNLWVAPQLKKNSKLLSQTKEFLSLWTVQCYPLQDWKIIPWLMKIFKSEDINISSDNCKFLIQKVGTNLGYLRDAAITLSLMITPQKNIDKHDILNLPTPSSEFSIYEFLGLLARRQTLSALNQLTNIYQQENREIVSILYQRIRDLWCIQISERNETSPSLCSTLGMHPFRVKKLLEEAKLFSVQELELMLLDLIHIQMGIVSGRVTSSSVLPALELCILKLIPNSTIF
jgi:DNA polymerase III delta subunit